jgi:uncharacterized protein
MVRTIYLHGFASGPESTKGRFFRERFEERGWQLDLPDLTEGEFEYSTLSRQLRYTEALVGLGPVVLIGSSMGGYLAALFAARHPDRVWALLLLAPAFGLAQRWAASMDAEELRQWKEKGWRDVYHYGEKRERRISYALIEDGINYEEFPDVQQDMLIFHGRKDDVVDPQLSVRFTEGRPNAELVLYDSDHQLTDVLEPLWRRAEPFLVRHVAPGREPQL